jgi:hypothetical protein
MNPTLSSPITKICSDCGAPFETLRTQIYRCDDCREDAKRNREAERRNREQGLSRYSTCHFVGFLPGFPKEDGDLIFVGRHLALHEVKYGPTGFLPDGLVLEARNGARVTETGVVINGRPVFTKIACNSGSGDV